MKPGGTKSLTFDMWWIILGAVLSLGRKVLAEERECLRRTLSSKLEVNIENTHIVRLKY